MHGKGWDHHDEKLGEIIWPSSRSKLVTINL